MKLSIVVVTWQSEPALRRLVDSMNAHLDGSQELIVVDNGSDDDPAAAAEAWRGRGRFLEMGDNLGFGAAANVGVARATGDAVVLLNPDTLLLDDGVARLGDRALRIGAIVGPEIRRPDGSRQPSASGPAVGVWPWIRACLPGPLGPAAVLRRTAPWRLDSLTRVSWLTGACIAAPRSLVQPLGPFDPTIHLYAEDLDLGLRADHAGIHSYFVPGDAAIVHEGKASTSQAFDDFGRAQAARNGRAVLRRHYGGRRERAAWAAEVLGLSLRVAIKTLLRRERAWDRAVLRGLLEARRVPPLAPIPAAGVPLAEPVAERTLAGR